MSDTAKDRFSQLLFYILLIVMGYLVYQVLSPFLAPLAWAAVFAMMFQGVHAELSSRIGPNRSALVTTLMTAVLIVAPAVLLVSVLAREVPQVIAYVQQASLSAPDQIERIWQVVRARVPMPLPEDPTALLREGVERVLAFLAPAAGGVVADVLATLGSLFVMLFSLFFLLRDGHILGRQIRDLLPLPERDRERLMTETRDLVIASVGAGLMVAAVQGLVAGVTFWALGFNGPVMWGVATAFCSLVPVVGSALVFVPAALWLFLSGEVARGGDPGDRCRARRRYGRQRAAAAHPERPHVGERPGRLSRPAWRRVGVRLHRSRARADHPRDRRQSADRVHEIRGADPDTQWNTACSGIRPVTARPVHDPVHDSNDVMRLALAEAERARLAGEVPVGAVILLEGRVVGTGFNQPILAVDPTAHAEVVALRAAARALGNYRLTGSSLYVTVEPCLMCVGAMIHARVARVVFGAAEPKAGALVSASRAHETPGLNHRLEVTGGVLEEECRQIMQAFFAERRGDKD